MAYHSLVDKDVSSSKKCNVLDNSIEILHIHNDYLNNEKYKNIIDSSIELYIKIFSEAPYYEIFNKEDVTNEFNDYIKNGYILLAIENNETVGFLCWDIDRRPSYETNRQLQNWGINPDNDIYISELGVSTIHRNKGIAKKLMNQFIKNNKNEGKNFYLRTGIENNDHVINFYKKHYNFTLTNITEDVFNNRSTGGMTWDTRVYMIKKKNSIGTIIKHLFPHDENDGNTSGCESWYDTGRDYGSDKDERDDDGNASGSESFYGSHHHYN